MTRPKGLPRVSAARVLWRFLVVPAVLFWFGLVRVADAVGLRWLFFALTGRRSEYERLTAPVALRRAFEVLGPTYVKLGQLVASGEAVFPERYSEEFRKLLDRVPPFSLAAVNRTLEQDLGEARARIVELTPTPMAAASIAQVHAAVLDDGSEVVVKIQRPHIGELAAADVALLRMYARVLSKISVHVRRANALAVIEDFEANLIEELDFNNEASRMREFNDVMRKMGTKDVAAPVVYDDLSGPRLLTMERFDGWRLDDTAGILGSPYDGKERLRQGVRAWFQTLIVRGFFHGDVHAGNFLLLRDGRIGYLDFGIVGVFDDEQKKNVLEYVLGFQQHDFARVAKAMLAMGTVDDAAKVDVDAFAKDLAVAYAPLIAPTEDFKMRDMLPDLLRVARAHSMRMPRDLVLVTKQLIYLDRYSRALGGHDMNVLTDKALSNLIMQDMLAAMFA
ncbi:MAG: AarF/ABC1/UbiB kinase family protein [Sandaracinaceae bacterium]|nr:AarF/ABC1/UbiB kinase family protein [Sandaracinaceae bacterium]